MLFHIPISDVLGLDGEGKLAPDARLPKILPAFLNLKDAPLDQVPFTLAKADLNFEKPVDVSAGDVSLTLGASGGGSLALIDVKRRALDESDPFNAIAVKPGEIYIALGFNFSTNASVSVSASPVTFGLATQAGIEVKCYRRFLSGTTGFPAFSKALGATASSFLLPQAIGDFTSLDAETVVAISGDGSLKVSAGVNVSLLTEGLASVGSGAANLQVNASGSFGASASLTISGGYQVRLRRLGDRTVEIGVYNVKGREGALRVSANVGVSAKAGSFDLAEQFIKTLSLQPEADVNEFRQALPGEDGPSKERQIEAFQSSLHAAISAKVQVSAAATLSSLRSDAAAWLFEIDLGAATSDQAATAISAALHGDFTGLTNGELPAGIVQKENVLTRTDLTKQTLNVNILGVLNLVSVAKLARISTIERNASGAITLVTDTSSANRLQAVLLNAGVDARRLRKMLSENFLIEAAYHATNLGLLPPEFRSGHTYLEIDDSTGKQEMKDNLDVARVLGLISRDEEERRLSFDRFGRTTFYAETRYTSEAVRRLFIGDNGSPRSILDYETAGRSALGALLAGDPGQEFRRGYTDLGLRGTALWREMKRIGNVASLPFARLFGLDVSPTDPRVAAAGSDYITITRWASAMNEAGAAIVEVENVLTGSAVDVGDAKLTKARDLLKQRMASVVSKTHDHFGDPLGLIMVYAASGLNAQRTVVVSGADVERLEASAEATSGLALGAANG